MSYHTTNEKESQNEKFKSVIRVYHNRKNPFVQLNKEALWDENLSLKAIGLWARCMSRPDDWNFNVKELVDKCKEGRKAIDSAIHELIEHNYAIRIDYHERGEDGKFTNKGVEYIFLEFAATQEEKNKIIEEFKKSFRDSHFGNFRNGDFQKEHLLIQKETEKEKHQYIVCVEKNYQTVEPLSAVCAAEPLVCLSDGEAIEEVKKESICTKEELSSCELKDYDRLEKASFNGKKHIITKNELFTYSVQKRKDWTREEMAEAWKVLIAYDQPIRDIYSFFEGTIKNNRKLKGLKTYEEKVENSYRTQNNRPTSAPIDPTNARTLEQLEGSVKEEARRINEELRKQEDEKHRRCVAESKQREDEAKRAKIQREIDSRKAFIASMTEENFEWVRKVFKREFSELTNQEKDRVYKYITGREMDNDRERFGWT